MGRLLRAVDPQDNFVKNVLYKGFHRRLKNVAVDHKSWVKRDMKHMCPNDGSINVLLMGDRFPRKWIGREENRKP